MTLWCYTTQLALTKYTNFLIHKNHKLFALGKNLSNIKNSDLVTTTKAREGKLSIKLKNCQFYFNPLTPTVATWHPMPERVKLSFVIFDIWSRWNSMHSTVTCRLENPIVMWWNFKWQILQSCMTSSYVSWQWMFNKRDTRDQVSKIHNKWCRHITVINKETP